MRKESIFKGISLILVLCMLIGLVPINAVAAPKKGKGGKHVIAETTKKEDTSSEESVENGIATLDLANEEYEVETISDSALSEALVKAKTYIDALTINNSENDPSTVVSNYGTHFTWDNEKRESSKSYLFDWSYYNGVVFEGIEYVYDETEEEVYGDYVEEYMSALIASNGTWAKCSNNSSKECAGYNSTHGADCYKTASLLLDMYERTEDSRYLTMAKTLYADLDTAANTYLLKNAGYNYRHTWASDPSPDLWLDGLYMVLPFRAEYAEYIEDTEELDLIVDRMQWVSDNMYNESKGLFYHAADSESSNSGTYWLRSIGWYAAAIVDVMDSMEGENLEAMKAQLVKLVDGMKACQNASNGMWLNNMAASQSSTNPYETSGTALVCYAVMKAVNEGWLDASYADMAILAFEGICNEKLSGTTLTDICFKGAPGSSNSTFYDNEGKGVGPFIMLYAEVMEYINDQAEEPETPVEPEDTEITVEDTTIKVENVTGLTGAVVTAEDKAVIEEKEYTNFVAYDISATLAEGAKAMVSIPVPAEWNATEDELVGISVEDGEVKEIKGTLSEDGIYSFEVEHFSAKGVAYNAKAVEETPVYSGTGNLVGGDVYTLDTDGVTANKNYLIVNTGSNGTGYALTNNGSNTPGSTEVNISNGKITVEDDSNIAWVFSGSTSGTAKNGTRYVYLGNSDVLSTIKRNLNISSQNNGAYRISYDSWTTPYYLRYSNNSWSRNSTASNVYLYEYTISSAGEEVTFAITPESAVVLAPNGTHALNGTVTVAGETVDLSNCTIDWSSTNTAAATVAEGTVTAVAEGTTYIKATLSAVNGTALQEEIVLTIPVSVESKKVASANLTGNTPVTTKKDVEPDFSNIKLEVTYEDGETAIITTENGLVIEGYDITEIGYTYAKIMYAGTEYGEVRVTVEGDPYKDLEAATDYPEYPADGAVRIDKTATHSADEFKNTGVTHVELDVAGISVKKGVNVIMISDISNSMSWDDSEYNYNDTTITAGTNQRLNISKESAKKFVNEFLKDNTGEATDNTFTLLAFAGIDGDYNTHNTAKANDDVYQLGDLAMTSISDAENAIDDLVKATTGGTNYDYAFQQAYALSQELYNKNGKEVYIVFMTDGVPTHYNGVYYKSRSNTDLTACMQYVDPTTGETSAYTSTGNDRNGNDIDSTATQSITVHYNDGTTATKNVTYNKGWSDYVMNNKNGWAEKVKALDYVSAVYSIGFGMKNGSVTQGATTSMPTLNNVNGGQYYIPSSTTQTVLKHIASTESGYYEADNADELNKLYGSLATQIKFAGTSAEVTDTIGSDFTLQMANYSGSGDKTATLKNPPSIAVTAYDLYTKADAAIDEDGNDLTGSRTGTYDVMEYVSFNADGTEAYSDQIGEGQKNIMTTGSDGTVTIEAFYFTYTKTPDGVETFKWTIGNITDKEIVLAFDAYLKGALEGEAEQGTYYTNEEATLEYIDINGKYAEQTFDVPHVNWGGASTTIRFYLVNENGEPVNHAGDVIPWANRIYVGEPVQVNLNLNADLTIPAQKIEAAAYVPGEYFLYDANAEYTVQTASGEVVTGGITISDPSDDAYKTTYDDNGNPVKQTGAQTTKIIDAEGAYFTWSVVGFGVRYDLSKEEIDPLNPDTIVMDYGKDIQVDVLANDTEIVPEGWTAELVGFAKYNANTDVKYIQANAGSETYDGASEYGAFSIVGDKVNYKPTKMLSAVQKVFCVIKLTEQANTSNSHYRYNVLNIVPATSVYYENDFADFITYTDGGAKWGATNETEGRDNLQDDGTVGTNEAYGYDTSYADDVKYSNGNAMAISTSTDSKVDGYNKTYATFTFTGTGFDLISMTSQESGMIRADIYEGDAIEEGERFIKYAQVANVGASTLYQIPVISYEGLDYGTYTVKLHVYNSYENTTTPELSRGGMFHFDALRVYDPINVEGELTEGSDAAIAQAAYVADEEAYNKHFEVREAIISAADFEATVEGTDGDGVVYIDASASSNITANPEATVQDYEADGPNNETYLINDSAVIGFILEVDKIPESLQIGAKSVLGNDVMMDMYIVNPNTIDEENDYYGDTAYLLTTEDGVFNHASAQNYSVFENEDYEAVTDFTPYFAEQEDGAYQTYVYISKMALVDENGDVIEDDNSILSITDFKATFAEESDMRVIYSNGLVSAYNQRNGFGKDEVVTSDVELYSAAFTKTSVRYTNQATLNIETSANVKEIVLVNEKGKIMTAATTVATAENGNSIWTLKFKPGNVGVRTFTVYGVGEDGSETDRATVSIEATRR